MALSIKEVKGLLDKSGVEIVGFTKMFPVESALENFTMYLTDKQKTIEMFYPQIDQIDFYRYIIIINLKKRAVYCIGFYYAPYIYYSK